MFRGDHWIQASRLVKKVGYLPQTVKNCVYEYHLKRVDSEPTLFAHFRFMNTSSGQSSAMRAGQTSDIHSVQTDVPANQASAYLQFRLQIYLPVRFHTNLYIRPQTYMKVRL